MARIKIVTDTEFLHKPSKPVVDFDARLHQLLDDMRDTLGGTGGVGLAAPQIGVLYAVCILRPFNDVLELINPIIVASGAEKIDDEACLSIPGQSFNVSRPRVVKVRAVDRHGTPFMVKLKGLAAVCACHEIDHLHGILITDKAVKK